MSCYYKGRKVITRPLVVKYDDGNKYIPHGIKHDVIFGTASFLEETLEIGKETKLSMTPVYEEVTIDDYIEWKKRIIPDISPEEFREKYKRLLIYIDYDEG